MINRAWNLWRRYWFDLGVIGLAILAAVEVAFRLGDNKDYPLHGTTWLMAAWAALMVLPLLARRRFPFEAPIAVFAIGLAGSLWNGTLATYTLGDFLAVLVATFLFGLLFERERSPIGFVIALGVGSFVVYNDPRQGYGEIAWVAFTFSLAWLAGLAIGSQLKTRRDRGRARGAARARARGRGPRGRRGGARAHRARAARHRRSLGERDDRPGVRRAPPAP